VKKIIIIGGGLAGLLASVQLAHAGVPCTVIEKKSYPFHRVCGEYISNEAAPFLKSLGVYPHEFSPPVIKRFQLSSISGYNCTIPLDLGGFGISRYTFDNFLFQKATKLGVEFLLNTEVEEVQFSEDKFEVKIKNKTLIADIVIGSFGKRSKLDIHLNRSFINKRSPFVGVKYHVKANHPHDLIALHNFVGGYCGMSNIEDGKTNVCYLTHRDNIKKYGNIKTMEKEILFKNPLLKKIFTTSEFLFKKPEVINEISFETKAPVENHILMVGDAAGMITPLCGNGMAMAMHASKIASLLIIKFCIEKNYTRAELEKNYTSHWKKTFSQRLWNGRKVQRLFGSAFASDLAVKLAIYSRPIANAIIKNTPQHIICIQKQINKKHIKTSSRNKIKCHGMFIISHCLISINN
jgi:menaquinone-9 beta-reductase